MPILEKTPRACFKKFRGHVAELVAATLTATRTIICAGDDQFQTLSFDGTGMIPIDTSAHGRLYFYLGQSLEAVQEKRRRFRLRTHQYWYRLQDRPGPKEKALIRWEYDSQMTPEKKNPARHHVQSASHVSTAGGHSLDLNRLHVPTGWVTIEEVFRFLINDLGVDPVSTDWPAVLVRSERAFFNEFTSKRHTP